MKYSDDNLRSILDGKFSAEFIVDNLKKMDIANNFKDDQNPILSLIKIADEKKLLIQVLIKIFLHHYVKSLSNTNSDMILNGLDFSNSISSFVLKAIINSDNIKVESQYKAICSLISSLKTDSDLSDIYKIIFYNPGVLLYKDEDEKTIKDILDEKLKTIAPNDDIKQLLEVCSYNQPSGFIDFFCKISAKNFSNIKIFKAFANSKLMNKKTVDDLKIAADIKLIDDGQTISLLQYIAINTRDDKLFIELVKLPDVSNIFSEDFFDNHKMLIKDKLFILKSFSPLFLLELSNIDKSGKIKKQISDILTEIKSSHLNNIDSIDDIYEFNKIAKLFRININLSEHDLTIMELKDWLSNSENSRYKEHMDPRLIIKDRYGYEFNSAYKDAWNLQSSIFYGLNENVRNKLSHLVVSAMPILKKSSDLSIIHSEAKRILDLDTKIDSYSKGKMLETLKEAMNVLKEYENIVATDGAKWNYIKKSQSLQADANKEDFIIDRSIAKRNANVFIALAVIAFICTFIAIVLATGPENFIAKLSAKVKTKLNKNWFNAVLEIGNNFSNSSPYKKSVITSIFGISTAAFATKSYFSHREKNDIDTKNLYSFSNIYSKIIKNKQELHKN